MTFYKVTPTKDTFAPEIHEWLAEVDGLYLYVLKDTDRWTPCAGILREATPVPTPEVPAHVRQKAGQRLGGARRAGHFTNRAGGVAPARGHG